MRGRLRRVGAALLAGMALHAAAQTPSRRIQSVEDLQSRGTQAIDPATHPGRAVFQQHCAMCHEGHVPKAPSPTFLGMMAPDAIVHALTDGVMKLQGAALAPAERVQVAEYLTRTPYAAYRAPPPPPRCTGATLAFDRADAPPPIGWGHDNRRFVPAAVAGLPETRVPSLRLKWAFAYPGALRARSQPTFAWGALYVGSQDGTVYAFDPGSGCVRWTHRFSAEVRTAIVADAAAHRLYMGDIVGRAHALDAFTGEEIWSTKVDPHPDATITGTPTLGGGLLYVPVSSLEVTQAADPAYPCCTFRGLVLALDPATGRPKWRAWSVLAAPAEQGRTPRGTPIIGPSGAPVWGSPTYDPVAGRVYFGTGENYSSPADDDSDALIAVDARTGRRLWQRQLTRGDAWNVGCMMGNASCPKENGPDHDLSASVLLIPLGSGKRILVAGQKSGMAWGIDPDGGGLVWSRALGHGGTQGGVHFGMAAEGTRVFVPVNDMADTRDARVYDATRRGSGLHALDAATGRELWFTPAPDDCVGRENCDPGISAAVTALPGAVLAGHLDGMLRAYDSMTGRVIWSYDTTRPMPTITGRTARGGSMSGSGPAVWHGLVAMNSGYGMYYHMAGDALMLFSPDGR